jgi:phenylacetate-coenzyme A ligase PaaK-like adenylate-forming protein
MSNQVTTLGVDSTTHGPRLQPADQWNLMRERLPQLRIEPDEWVSRMMRWHFSPETGSPFWLRRRRDLGFDPIRDVRGVADLDRFGLFDKRDLRDAQVRDLLPQGFHGRPFRVVETGGTTGKPIRVVDVTRATNDVAIYRAMLEARGVAGGDAVAMAPSGPHAYGHFVTHLVNTWAGAAYFIDFDPRWVKHLIRADASTQAYVQHLTDQTESLLRDERPALLFTTSKLLLELVAVLPRPLADYGVRAVCTGGTSCSPEEARYLRAEHLGAVQWIDNYGSTLMGHALPGEPLRPGTSTTYHLPPPLSFIRVVDPADPQQDVPVGTRGRVLVNTLLEDLFIPNLLERDSAESTEAHPWFPWPGVQHVRPYEAPDAEAVTEGVY